MARRTLRRLAVAVALHTAASAALAGERIRAGASDYIAKPVHLETLLTTLARCLARK